MAEYRDFFKLAHDDSYDKQPLVKLRDNDRIPDLRKYTMGDLRSWVAENSPGLPSVLPKGVIRASSQLADGVVTSSKILDGTIATSDLADKAITPDKIDWSQMPPVRLVSWVSADDSKFNLTTGGSTDYAAGTDVISTIPTLLPARAGYTRQYRFTGNVVHLNAGGETAWGLTLYLYWGDVPGAYLGATGIAASEGGADVTTKVWAPSSGWVVNSVLDASTDGDRLGVYYLKNYLGGNPTMYLRSMCLEGRYV